MTTRFGFIGKSGYTLDDVKIYSATDIQNLLLDGLEAEEVEEAYYRVELELTGLVYMIAKPSASLIPNYRGWVNLDVIGPENDSEVFDTYDEAVEAGNSSLNDLMESIGPRRVKTKTIEIEAHDPLKMQMLLERRKLKRVSFGSFSFTRVVPCDAGPCDERPCCK